MRVYLDVCCLNRPFDDQSQERVRLETEVLILLFLRVQAGDARWVSSEVNDYEVSQTPNMLRRSRVVALARTASEHVRLEAQDEERGVALGKLGFGSFDALHVACAERAGVDALLTTDDGLVKLAARHANELHVVVRNPLRWYLESMEP